MSVQSISKLVITLHRSENQKKNKTMELTSAALVLKTKVGWRGSEALGKPEIRENQRRPKCCSPLPVIWLHPFFFSLSWTHRHGRLSSLRFEVKDRSSGAPLIWHHLTWSPPWFLSLSLPRSLWDWSACWSFLMKTSALLWLLRLPFLSSVHLSF